MDHREAASADRLMLIVTVTPTTSGPGGLNPLCLWPQGLELLLAELPLFPAYVISKEPVSFKEISNSLNKEKPAKKGANANL